MKYIYYAVTVIIFAVLITINFRQKAEFEKKTSEMKDMLKLDSAILHNYQRAMGDFIDEDPDCANKFMILIEQHDIK